MSDLKTYLGDGVYGDVENGMLKLTADGHDGEQVIYLEPEVLDALNRWAAMLRQREPLDAANEVADSGATPKEI